MGDTRNSSSVDSTLGPKQNLFGRLQSATDGASTGSSASAAPPGKDVGIKRDTETQVSDKVKRMNSALHSPLKKMPQSEAEPTIADVMNVLLDQGRKMATKQDLREMQSEILRDTKIEIATAVDPLKEEVCELRDRVSKIESKARSPAAAGATDKQLMELQRLVQECDPALKRVAFTGWPDTVTPEARLQKITEFLNGHCAGLHVADTDHFYSGPYNDRKITKASFAEFVSSDAAKHVD